ncbi:hypothetical protein FIBSPDRAFT_919604 [Athelia psychrophila]|uniref:Velvet domain-containing protein n=1 Tax=Athelia psychrophila TaxID=1759441 RepID=A0A166JX89_9AGAM|nr:hypothetical protein FIBSPDRAFT_919604 [Fibularhizoctonia sp. CBS 109695]
MKNARRPAVSYVGQPMHFATGQFAGQTIRTELIEVQQAELGRKYARVDRRPLDPPPAVLFKIFRILNPGTDDETESEVENYDDVQSIGLLCTVDLFPVPSSVLPGHAEVSGLNVLSSSHHSPYIASSQSDASAFPGYNHPPGNHNYSVPMPPPIHITVPQQPHDQVAHRPGPGYYSPANTTWDIVAYAGTHPIIENSKCTNALVGQTFVQSYKVKYKGRMVLMFVFADLAIKIEGVFILRYRAFDIFSKKYNDNELAIQSECYGGAFRVYSTKDFPGLQASTELTKDLARWGVRLNIRESERKVKRRGRSPSPPPTLGKRKGREEDSDEK